MASIPQGLVAHNASSYTTPSPESLLAVGKGMAKTSMTVLCFPFFLHSILDLYNDTSLCRGAGGSQIVYIKFLHDCDCPRHVVWSGNVQNVSTCCHDPSETNLPDQQNDPRHTPVSMLDGNPPPTRSHQSQPPSADRDFHARLPRVRFSPRASGPGRGS